MTDKRMDLDITILFQMTLLIVLVAILRPLVFAPMLKLFANRYQQTEGTKQEVDKLERLSVVDEQTYLARMQATHRESTQQREALRAAGRDKARDIIKQARTAIAAELVQARSRFAARQREAEQALDSDVETLAQQLMHKLLGRKGA